MNESSKRTISSRANAGKQRSSRYAVRHGLLSNRTVLLDELPDIFETLLSRYREKICPPMTSIRSMSRKWRSPSGKCGVSDPPTRGHGDGTAGASSTYSPSRKPKNAKQT